MFSFLSCLVGFKGFTKNIYIHIQFNNTVEVILVNEYYKYDVEKIRKDLEEMQENHFQNSDISIKYSNTIGVSTDEGTKYLHCLLFLVVEVEGIDVSMFPRKYDRYLYLELIQFHAKSGYFKPTVNIDTFFEKHQKKFNKSKSLLISLKEKKKRKEDIEEMREYLLTKSDDDDIKRKK
jgi:hypothetical protein